MNKWFKRFLIGFGLLLGFAGIYIYNFISHTNKLNRFFYAVHTQDYETMQKLINHGININEHNPKTGDRALEIAVRDNNMELAEFLINNKASLKDRINGKPLSDDVPPNSAMYNVLKNAELNQQ